MFRGYIGCAVWLGAKADVDRAVNNKADACNKIASFDGDFIVFVSRIFYYILLLQQ